MHTTGSNATAIPRLGHYTIDTSRSSIAFTSRHFFNLLPVHGTFGIRAGTVEVAEPLSESSVRVEVDAGSISSGNEQRDAAVRSAKFLDTDRRPLFTFVSERVDTTTVSGTLTACGVERPVSLSVVRSEVTEETFTVRATARIDRTDFGITAARAMAGRVLDLTLEATCVRR